MSNDTSYYSKTYISFLNTWIWPVIAFLFRIEVQGLENIKSEKSLLIANHNSGALIESHSLLLLLFQRGIQVFGLNHQALFKVPFIGKHFRKIGAVSANFEQAEFVLSKDVPLLIFPGGNRQAFRSFSQRHDHTFPWAKGWAQIAVEKQIPVVPIKFIGTHQINPIFFNSKILSKILILPKLLQISWFPLSLAQLIFSIGLFIFLKQIHVNIFFSSLSAYLAFCLTPLIPILPSKVKIKVYSPLRPNVDFKTSHELLSQMNLIMSKIDYPFKKQNSYALNGIEKFIYAHESNNIHYNSQLIFNFSGELDKNYLLKVTEDWIREVPYVRSFVDDSLLFPVRKISEHAWFRAEDIFLFSDEFSLDEVDNFCHRPFALAFEPAVRFLLQSTVKNSIKQHRLIFSCHHSLFDGAGQAYAFECWARLFNQQSVPEEFKHTKGFRYRSIAKHLGYLSSLKLLWKHIGLKPPRALKNIATLADLPENESRFVTAKTISLNNYSANLPEDLNRTIEAFQNTLQDAQRNTDNIFVIIPMGLRWVLRLKSTMQNAVVSAGVFLKQIEFLDPQWKNKIKKKISMDILLANQKFLFGTLSVSFFTPFRLLKNRFLSMDQSYSATSSSFLFVHAPIPKAFPLPREWQNIQISARGTLLRSPNVGVIITGQKGNMTLTVEYLKHHVSQEKINTFIRYLENSFKQENCTKLTDLSL